MKFQIAAAALAATAAAAPNRHVIRQNNNSTIVDGTPFTMVSIRSGSALQYASFSAEAGSLGLNVADQGATCACAQRDYATFFLSEGEMHLFTAANVTQKLYVDRSGMGQGILGYTTTPGGYSAGRNSETVGWAIDQYGDLTFAGANFLACPGFNGSYSVWVSAGVATPGGNSNCTGIAVRTQLAAEPVTCTYSYTPAE